MIKSPMFNHAVESFQHGVEHYFESSPKSRKFAFLHIDQSIELFLKEKLVDSGRSIYKDDGKTLSIHEAFNSISKITSIPERPRLEELHDLRNVIQHKGVLPDQATTDFFTKIAYHFIKRFVRDEFSIDISAILPQHSIGLFEAPEPISLPDQVSRAIDEALLAQDNMSKVMGLYTAIELAAKHLAVDVEEQERVKVKEVLRKSAVAHGVPESRFNKQFKFLDILRGQIMHSEKMPEDKEVEGYLNTLRRILNSVGFLSK